MEKYIVTLSVAWLLVFLWAVNWEPDWTAYNGSSATDCENGSSWENATLFDFSWKALQGFSAFN
jgi:hypothetical protein